MATPGIAASAYASLAKLTDPTANLSKGAGLGGGSEVSA